MITVISTTYNPPADARRRCIDSVAKQITEHEHIYIDAAEQPTPLSHFQNFFDVVRRLPPDRIVACVDGDDWLYSDSSLAHVERAHANGAVVTYGSFVYADGRPGFAREMTPTERENPRQHPWVATHLKTFRAGLLYDSDDDHAFQDEDGNWLTHARDMALMWYLFGCINPNAVHYIPETLYVYNYANSTEFHHTPETAAAERDAVRWVRGM